MKSRLFTIVLIFISINLNGQSLKDIEMKSNFWSGTKFYYQNNEIEEKYVLSGLSNNREILRRYVDGKSSHSTAKLISAVGGILIGWPIGTALGGGDPKWWLAGIGGGLTIFMAKPIYSKGSRKMQKALDLYNSSDYGMKLPPDKENVEISFRVNSAGIGIGIIF